VGKNPTRFLKTEYLQWSQNSYPMGGLFMKLGKNFLSIFLGMITLGSLIFKGKK